jgi:hypothetical protein
MAQVPLDDFVDFNTATYVVNGIAGSHRWQDCMESIDQQIAARKTERHANRPAQPSWVQRYVVA